jgi:hypothetical protein
MRFLLIILLAPVLFAQQPNALKRTHVRFLPVGDQPPWKERIENGVRIQIPPPPGAVPPNEVTISVSGAKSETIPLVLGRMSKQLEVGGKIVPIQLFEGDVARGDSWFDARLRPGATALVVLCRDPAVAGATWAKPVSKVVPDDLASFPDRTIRLVNVSRSRIAIRIDQEKAFSLTPGEFKFKTLKSGKRILLIGEIRKEGGTKTLFKNMVPIEQGKRNTVVIYRSDGGKGDGVAKVRMFPERAPAPLKK